MRFVVSLKENLLTLFASNRSRSSFISNCHNFLIFSCLNSNRNGTWYWFAIKQRQRICTQHWIVSTLNNMLLGEQCWHILIYILPFLIRVFDIIMLRAERPWNHFDFIYKWTNLYKLEQKYMANIRFFTNRVSCTNHFIIVSIEIWNNNSLRVKCCRCLKKRQDLT